MQKLLTEDRPGITTASDMWLPETKEKMADVTVAGAFPPSPRLRKPVMDKPSKMVCLCHATQKKRRKWGWFRVVLHFLSIQSHVLSHERVVWNKQPAHAHTAPGYSSS